MLPPHFHPRASNYVVAIHGTTATYMIPENGGGVVKQTLSPGKMTIFPQASLHTMMNLGKLRPLPMRLSPISVAQAGTLCRVWFVSCMLLKKSRCSCTLMREV